MVHSAHAGPLVAVHVPVRKKPSVQSVTHVVHAPAPVAVLYVPLSHGTHSGPASAVHCPTSRWPGGHVAVHGAQRRSVTASGASVWCCPAAHGVQGAHVVSSVAAQPPVA